MAVKRLRGDEESEEEMDCMRTANYLILLSRGDDDSREVERVTRLSDRVFKCKTCNREFTSFQALGGHRASHKKPRTIDDHHKHNSPVKPKVHECSICGLEFSIGQALGGHMRRHRNTIEGFSVVPMVKKSDVKKVLYLDLNLPPSENEHPELVFGIGLGPKMSIVH